MQKLLSYLKSPVLWAGLAVGAVLALAYAAFFRKTPLNAAAKVLPKSGAA